MHDIPNLQCTYIGLHSNFCNPPPKRSLDGFRRTYVWNTVVPREYMTRSHNNDYLVLSYKTVMRFPRRNRSPRASRRRYLFIYLLLFIYIYIFFFFYPTTYVEQPAANRFRNDDDCPPRTSRRSEEKKYTVKRTPRRLLLVCVHAIRRQRLDADA